MKKTIITGLVVFSFGIISFLAQSGTAQAAIATVPTATTPFANALGTNNKLYVIGYSCNCLYVHDVTDKSHVTTIATVTVSAQPEFVVFNNNYLYIGTYSNAIDIFNVTNPAVPVRVGKYQLPNGYGVSKMRLVDNKLFVSFYQNGLVGPGGIKIFDVTNPATLQPISTINFAETRSGGGDILPIGNYLYVADYFGLSLKVYDISNISAPVLLQKIINVREPLDYATFEPWRLLSRGDALYVIDDNIIQTYDISNPSSLWYSTTTVAFKDGEGVDIIGGIMYFSSSFDHTLAWYDISDPFTIKFMGSVNTGQNNYWMAIDEQGYVYVNSTSDNTVNVYSPITQQTTDIPVRTPLFSDQCRAAEGYTCGPVYYYYNPFVTNDSRGTISTTLEIIPATTVATTTIITTATSTTSTTATTTVGNNRHTTKPIIKFEPRKPEPVRINIRRGR